MYFFQEILKNVQYFFQEILKNVQYSICNVQYFFQEFSRFFFPNFDLLSLVLIGSEDSQKFLLVSRKSFPSKTTSVDIYLVKSLKGKLCTLYIAGHGSNVMKALLRQKIVREFAKESHVEHHLPHDEEVHLLPSLRLPLCAGASPQYHLSN